MVILQHPQISFCPCKFLSSTLLLAISVAKFLVVLRSKCFPKPPDGFQNENQSHEKENPRIQNFSIFAICILSQAVLATIGIAITPSVFF